MLPHIKPAIDSRFQWHDSVIKIMRILREHILQVSKKALYVTSGNLEKNVGPIRAMLLPWLLAWLILIFVSFGMLWLGDKINGSGMALTRFMARVQAPLTAQFAYTDIARDQITVLMYDQEFLKSSGSAWPISYQDHGDALMRLTQDPNARPKAIFLDIAFNQERSDPTIDALRHALCTIQNDYKVPVFLAALPSEKGPLAVRPGLSPGPSSGETNCFTLVGVDYIPDHLDGVAWTYQLSRHLTDTGWHSGPSTNAQPEPTYRSAAMAIAQDVGRIDLGEETVPMAMLWGHNSAPQTDRPESLSHCRPGRPDTGQLVPFVLRQLWEESSEQPLCPYHRTLSMGQLSNFSESELAPHIGGRYVIIGANVPGYNDFADSPVHRLTPGVYMHAMALDNLLTYKGDYKLSAEWTLPPSKALLLPGLLAISSVFLVHLIWALFARQSFDFIIKSNKRAAAVVSHLDDPKSSTPRQRVSQMSINGLLWLLRISIQTVAAVFLIAILQAWFRIGMLPVVELVSMTLIAEGLGYMGKIRWIFFGPSPTPALSANEQTCLPPMSSSRKKENK